MAGVVLQMRLDCGDERAIVALARTVMPCRSGQLQHPISSTGTEAVSSLHGQTQFKSTSLAQPFRDSTSLSAW